MKNNLAGFLRLDLFVIEFQATAAVGCLGALFHFPYYASGLGTETDRLSGSH